MSARDRSADIEAYLSGALSGAERVAFERDILNDPELAEIVFGDVEVRSMIASAGQAPRAVSGRAVRRTRWFRWPMVLVPAAATAAIALSILIRPSGEDSDVFRGGVAGFSVVEPIGELAALPRRVSWRPHPSAAFYRIELFDADSHRLVSEVVAETSFSIDDGIRVPTSGYVSVEPLNASLSSVGDAVIAHFEVRE